MMKRVRKTCVHCLRTIQEVRFFLSHCEDYDVRSLPTLLGCDCSLFEIMQTLYWAMYGLVDLDAIYLREDHTFTQFAGKVMFGVYNYISIIVLVNMLIAMMNTSYQIISVSDVHLHLF